MRLDGTVLEMSQGYDINKKYSKNLFEEYSGKIYVLADMRMCNKQSRQISVTNISIVAKRFSEIQIL